MSFLMNLVPCCGGAGHTVTANAPTEEETTSLVQVPDKENRNYRGGRVGRRSTVAPLLWRPTLCTISEDDVVREDSAGGVHSGLVKSVVTKPKLGAFRYRIELRLQESSASMPSGFSAFSF